MVDEIVSVLAKDQALAEIIRAQREERVPMLDYADLSRTDLSGENIRGANLSERYAEFHLDAHPALSFFDPIHEAIHASFSCQFSQQQEDHEQRQRIAFAFRASRPSATCANAQYKEARSMASPSATTCSPPSNMLRYISAISRFRRSVLGFSYASKKLLTFGVFRVYQKALGH